jgi:hypothetical protein
MTHRANFSLKQNTDRKVIYAVGNLKVCVTSTDITPVLNLMKIGQNVRKLNGTHTEV